MSMNKNVFLRIKILDDLLSDRRGHYSVPDIVEICNDRLAQFGVEPVTRRTIEKDLDFLKNNCDFYVEIDKYDEEVLDVETIKNKVKHCIRYKEEGFSIFKKPLSDNERYLLEQALNLIGQFDGLPEFENLNQLKKSLNVQNHSQIVMIQKNPLENSNLFGSLFDAVSQNQVIKVYYDSFRDNEGLRNIILHPYILKEYNRRWYVVGWDDDKKWITNLALDRIMDFEICEDIKYIESNIDFKEYYEDIIGVTVFEEKELEKIEFWVSDTSKGFVKTKPLHESQRHLSGKKELELREKFPKLEGGEFFMIECKQNYELIRELTSFGGDLLVLSSGEIQNSVLKRISEMQQNYEKLRT